MSQVAVKIRISRVDGMVADVPLPSYATSGSSGMDVRSSVDLMAKPGETVLVPTGFQIEIPPGYEAQVRPRSGLGRLWPYGHIELMSFS
ncbi:MAG: hypothetical protein HYR76_05535 [Ignavibacteria bacterium]|nr:hypothetical protein [Ignavibacteria bacterium]